MSGTTKWPEKKIRKINLHKHNDPVQNSIQSDIHHNRLTTLPTSLGVCSLRIFCVKQRTIRELDPLAWHETNHSIGWLKLGVSNLVIGYYESDIIRHVVALSDNVVVLNHFGFADWIWDIFISGHFNFFHKFINRLDQVFNIPNQSP